MTTIGEALNSLDHYLFVGRKQELDSFRQWVSEEQRFPEILNIYGRGGVGKSTLLRAFARVACEAGKRVLLVDARDSLPTLERWMRDMNNESVSDGGAHQRETSAVLLIDSIESGAILDRSLRDELLQRLPSRVKVVIAGRYPLRQSWIDCPAWHLTIHPLPLDGFSPKEAREYLQRRGVPDDDLIGQLVVATGGNPLALTLAADMVLQMGIRDLIVATEWHLVVRSLVERLLRDVKDSLLRELLECCAIVRQFDEDTLRAVSGRVDISSAFDRLCRLSVLRTAEHGLRLHDDIRRALADDLRWRRRDRYRELRSRALSYYRERMRSAPPSEREWLVAERFFLWENGFIQILMFREDDPGQISMDSARPEDYPQLRKIWSTWVRKVLAPAVKGGVNVDGSQELMEFVLTYPGARVRVARDRNGDSVGFNSALPLSMELLPLIEQQPLLATVARAYRMRREAKVSLKRREGASEWCLVQIAHTDAMPETVHSALLRDHMGLFALEGVYYVTTPIPSAKAFLQSCGFERIPEAQCFAWGSREPTETFVLDLSLLGVELWIESLLGGHPLPGTVVYQELEEELRQILLHWKDDIRVGKSILADLKAISPALPISERATALRQAILGTLATARATASPAQAEAFRVLELAYIDNRGISRDAMAEQIAVSRATFYRLLKRGLEELAEAFIRY